MPAAKTTAFPDYLIFGRPPEPTALEMHARLLGSRIDTRQRPTDQETRLLAARAGLTFVFRDGVAVTIGADHAAITALDEALTPRIVTPAPFRETETTAIVIDAAGGDSIHGDGRLQLADGSVERFQLAATVLARSVMLSRDEILVSEAFDRISPLVDDLRETGRTDLPIRQAMRLVGNALAARHRIMGTASANDRPDLLWDHPGLDRLYARLEAEYELDERAEVLERKFVALGDVTEVLLDIVRDKRAFRLELAIIALIALEIVLSVVAMAIR